MKGTIKPLILSAIFFDKSVLELKNDDEFDACCDKAQREKERKDRMVQEISPIGPMKVQLGKSDYTFPLEENMSWEDWKKVTDRIPENMIWRESSIRQNATIERMPLEDMIVCSSHTSKSCKLPVVKAMVTPGVMVILRGNFYDWKVSVAGDKPLTGMDSDWLFDPDNEIATCYFEGFQDNWCFGSYSNNQSEFSVELDYNPLALYTFLRELKRAWERDS